MRNEAGDIVQDHPDEATIQDLRHKAMVAGEAAWDMTRATYQELHNKTLEYSRITDEAIRTNPYRFVGIGFGIGLLIGMCLMRNNND